MASMDIFNDDAFSLVSMIGAIEKVDYAPNYLGELGIFTKTGVRTEDVFIEERSNAPALIHTSAPGTAPEAAAPRGRRGLRSYKTVRFAKGRRINASEVQGIRAFGSETELSQVEAEVVQRQSALKADADFTYEHYRLGVVCQAKMLDADGTVLYDWASEFGQAIPAAINFDLTAADPETGAIRKKCNDLRRTMVKNLKGVGGTGAGITIHAVVGDDFWDEFVNHSEVIRTYENQQAANQLREGHGGAWETFRYGNVTWHNYRGSDDGEVGVAADEASFFPIGAGIFQQTNSPLETFDLVNTVGKEFYSMIVRDKDRNMWADVEAYARPLFVCTMPSALRKGTVEG
jgi:hypothetical protein